MGEGTVMRVLFVLVVLLASLLPTSAAAASCGFKLGFKAIADQIPATVGQCLEDEHANPANGDALQKTSGGLLVWRKADNFTAFTDGYRSWVSGPLGLQSRLNTERFDWEGAPASSSVPRTAADARATIAQDPRVCAPPWPSEPLREECSQLAAGAQIAVIEVAGSGKLGALPGD